MYKLCYIIEVSCSSSLKAQGRLVVTVQPTRPQGEWRRGNSSFASVQQKRSCRCKSKRPWAKLSPHSATVQHVNYNMYCTDLFCLPLIADVIYLIDRCCFNYCIRNGLVALLESSIRSNLLFLSSWCAVKEMTQRIARIPCSIGPVGTRVLGPTLFSPDVADCFRRDSILACELGRRARSLGLAQEKDMDSLVRGKPDSVCHCPRSSL